MKHWKCQECSREKESDDKTIIKFCPVCLGGMDEQDQVYNKRSKEFLECLGNGKTIYQCESENDMIDELFFWEKHKTGRKKC